MLAGPLVAVVYSMAACSGADLATIMRADITYATVDGAELKLDLYLPKAAGEPKLIVWVHGGAWRAGSKADMPLHDLVTAGYAIASVDYRLSTVAPFPAQIHDIKAAIRFLRAECKTYGYSAESIAIAGSSAGGHLAPLVAVTNGHKELEGRIGEHLDESSDVQTVVSFFGMSNLTTILAQSTAHGLKVRVPALQLLLGGQPDEKPELAKLASPVFHVDAADPPLLWIHGDQDPQVPLKQAHELEERYKAVKIPCRFVVLHGGKHGGDEFFDQQRLKLMQDFLAEHLK